MARKSSPASSGRLPAALTPGDLIAGCVGVAAGGALFALLVPVPAPVPVPAAPGGAWPAGEGLPGPAAALAWSLALAGYAGFGGFSLVLARVDLRTRTLPNRLVAFATLWVLALLSLASVVGGDGWAALGPLAAAGVMLALMLVLWLSPRGAVGGGDLKLMPVAAYAAVWGMRRAGWVSGLCLFAGFIAAGVVVAGIVALIRHRREFAAGPLILTSSWLTLAATHSRD